MSIGENIKLLRAENGLTQEELSKKVGISRPMLAQIERGTKTVTLPIGKLIAEVFGCSVDDLVNDDKRVLNDGKA
ncbi:MAG: helix-turn-helix transcriptional regulator [Clostridiales bacterium]|nr:helix-turn-helix transcriptional regulator [Clostridiales bacterium]